MSRFAQEYGFALDGISGYYTHGVERSNREMYVDYKDGHSPPPGSNVRFRGRGLTKDNGRIKSITFDQNTKETTADDLSNFFNGMLEAETLEDTQEVIAEWDDREYSDDSQKRFTITKIKNFKPKDFEDAIEPGLTGLHSYKGGLYDKLFKGNDKIIFSHSHSSSGKAYDLGAGKNQFILGAEHVTLDLDSKGKDIILFPDHDTMKTKFGPINEDLSARNAVKFAQHQINNFDAQKDVLKIPKNLKDRFYIGPGRNNLAGLHFMKGGEPSYYDHEYALIEVTNGSLSAENLKFW